MKSITTNLISNADFGAKESPVDVNRKIIGRDTPIHTLTGDFSVSAGIGFPEAKDYMRRQSRKIKRTLSHISRIEEINKYIITKKVSKENQQFWSEMAEGIITLPIKEKLNQIVKRNDYLLRDRTKEVIDIQRAKQFPISNLIQFRQNKALCIFHSDRNPSLQYYPKTNTVYCFSCQTSGDSIKVYQTLNSCKFIEAVKSLQ